MQLSANKWRHFNKFWFSLCYSRIHKEKKLIITFENRPYQHYDPKQRDQIHCNLQNIEEIFLAFPASILKRTLNFQHSRIFRKLETGFLKTHYKFPKSSNYRRFPNKMKYNKTHIHTQKKKPQNNQQTNNTNAFNEGLHCSGISETFKQFSFL